MKMGFEPQGLFGAATPLRWSFMHSERGTVSSNGRFTHESRSPRQAAPLPLAKMMLDEPLSHVMYSSRRSVFC